MPCMGPDLKWARQQGRKVGKRVLVRLIDEASLFDITDPRYKKMFRLPGATRRWKRAKVSFIKAVEELFVEDACNGF